MVREKNCLDILFIIIYNVFIIWSPRRKIMNQIYTDNASEYVQNDMWHYSLQTYVLDNASHAFDLHTTRI